MAISYNYDAEHNIVQVKAKGILSVENILNYVTTIIKNKDIKKGFVEIVDLESVEDLIFNYTDTIHFPDLWRKYLEKGSLGSIIYAPTVLSYGIMRMLQTVLLDDEEAEKIPFIVVRTKEEINESLKQIRT
jgi:hypothetical protein